MERKPVCECCKYSIELQIRKQEIIRLEQTIKHIKEVIGLINDTPKG